MVLLAFAVALALTFVELTPRKWPKKLWTVRLRTTLTPPEDGKLTVGVAVDIFFVT